MIAAWQPIFHGTLYSLVGNQLEYLLTAERIGLCPPVPVESLMEAKALAVEGSILKIMFGSLPA